MLCKVPAYTTLVFKLDQKSKFVRHLYVRRHRDTSTNDSGDDATLFVANVPADATPEVKCGLVELASSTVLARRAPSTDSLVTTGAP